MNRTEEQAEQYLFEIMEQNDDIKTKLAAVKFYLSNKGFKTGYAKALKEQDPDEKVDLSKFTKEELLAMVNN